MQHSVFPAPTLARSPEMSIGVDEAQHDARSPRTRDGTVATPLKVRLVTLAAVGLPILGTLFAMGYLWGTGFRWIDLALFLSLYLITGFGITAGYHRLFTHRSYSASRPLTFALLIAGSMAVQGPLLQWVANHRRHHQHSDDEGDPHSPHLHGDSIFGSLRGMLHSHIGWMLSDRHHPVGRYVGDLRKDHALCAVARLFPLWVALGILLPGLIGGLVSMSWTGALLAALWGGLVRIFVGHHVTWSINSVCHIWGARPFDCGDESRNNPVFGVLAFGEGWHNNHHAFPTSARHGLRWWQFDASYAFIRVMSWLGLASDVKVPSRDRISAKLRQTSH